MKLKSLYFILISIPVLFFASCLGNSDAELSSDPNFVSLTFLKNDSIKGLENAVFSLEYDGSVEGDSIIVNLDSLPYNTRIDSVWPVFNFRSTHYTWLFQETEEGMDTIYLGGNSSSTKNDTIDFTRKTWVQNFSAVGTPGRTYPVKVNVHQVEPDLYVWKELNSRMPIAAKADVNQKALFFKDNCLFFTASETTKSMYTSGKQDNIYGNTWTQGALNFPATNTTQLKLRHMQVLKNSLFVTDNENRLYKSDNGEDWTEAAYNVGTGGKIHNLLFSMADSLWAITTKELSANEKEYRIAYSTTGTEWTDWGKLPEKELRKFPISEYSALVFKSAAGRPKVLIVGGNSEAGPLILANWIGQINAISKQFVLEPLNIKEDLPPVQDAAIIQYDKKILLFGGMNDQIITPLMESKNEGLSWSVPDSAYNILPESFPARTYQSVFVDETEKRIYIVGGQDTDGYVFSDVWTAKLNRLNWENK